MVGIYKITSPTKKIYIGQSIDIKKRFNQYKLLKCKAQPIVYKSLLKYGFNKHKFEILEQCEIIELNNKERYYQELYSAVGVNGLNCQLINTDELKRIFSDYTKEKMSISAKKKIFTKEHLDKITKIILIINQKRKGRKLSIETKQKLRDVNLGTKCIERQGFKHYNSKIVLDLSNGIFYGSVKHAADSVNMNYSTLKDNLSGRRNIKNKTNFIYA